MVAPTRETGQAGTAGSARPRVDQGADSGREPDLERLGDDVMRLWDAARRDLAAMGRETQRLAGLRWQRVRLAIREGGWTLVFGAWLALVGVVMTVVASVLFVLGLAQGVSALVDDTAWVGRLVVGVGIVGGYAAAFFVLRRHFERRFAEQLRRRYEPTPPAPSPSEAHGQPEGA